MRRQLLESIAARGGLLSMWWSDQYSCEAHELRTQLQALCGDSAGLLLDMGGCLPELREGPDCGPLFARRLDIPQEAGQWEGFAAYGPSPVPYPEDAASMRRFLGNLQNARQAYPFVIVMLPSRWQPSLTPILASSSLVLCHCSTPAEAAELAKHLENTPKAQDYSLWWTDAFPEARLYPRLAKGQKAWKEVPRRQSGAELWKDLLRIRILLHNPPEGWLFRLARWGFLPTLMLCLLPFLPVTDLGHPISGLRDLRADRARFAEAATLPYLFDGQQPIQRVARFALGRYTSLVSDEAMIASYVKETLERNGLKDSGWQRSDPLLYPPAGTQIQFYPPENLHNPRRDIHASAWRFFTGMLTDSIAYVTEFYHAQESPGQRKHDGLDIGAGMGARILAPFSAKAWTAKDDRGGVIIGLVRGQDVMLFMHCDQLLYLDGQDVMEGDPIATVGMTGHTTGPHVHLATGLVAKDGSRSIGPVRYKPLDPMEWYRVQAKRHRS